METKFGIEISSHLKGGVGRSVISTFPHCLTPSAALDPEFCFFPHHYYVILFYSFFKVNVFE